MYVFESENLGFKPMAKEDREDFIGMNEDPIVMKYFPALMTREESCDFFQKIGDRMEAQGYGLYGVYLKEEGSFIGFIGFNPIGFSIDDYDLEGKIEIGWRLLSPYHGKGYGREGARRVLEYGFKDLNFKRVYSFTARGNLASEGLMKSCGLEKLGSLSILS